MPTITFLNKEILTCSELNLNTNIEANLDSCNKIIMHNFCIGQNSVLYVFINFR